MSRRRTMKFWALLGISLTVILIFYVRTLGKDPVYATIDAQAIDLDMKYSLDAVPPYLLVNKGYTAADYDGSEQVDVIAAKYKNRSADARIGIIPDEKSGSQVMQWTDMSGWVEWDVHIPQDGLYNLQVIYNPVPGQYSSAVMGIQIDGQYPFREAKSISLDRYWKDSKFPYDKNAIGQQVRPMQEELTGWKTSVITDYSTSSEPLKWHLTEGKHTIRLLGVKGAVALRSLSFSAPEPVPAYSEYVRDQEAEAPEQQKPWTSVTEAEQFRQKSQISIQTAHFSEPHISPDPKGRVVYNTLGGEQWKQPGDWVEWEFEVPEDGMYVIDLKYMQSFRNKANVYRTLFIDNQVPFREMLHYTLPYNKDFQIHTLQDAQGTAFQFYLTKGKHDLRLVADSSPVEPAYIALNNTLRELNLLGKDIQKITGNYTTFISGTNALSDMSRTWDLNAYFPQLESKLAAIIQNLHYIADYMNGINQHHTDLTTAIDSVVNILNRMLEDVDQIPNRMKDFADIDNGLSTWTSQLTDQPLMLDFIVVRTPGTTTGLKEPTLLANIPYSTVNFFRSFSLKYDLRAVNREDALTVWINRPRDYVDLLQEMIEQEFNKQTGIHVNVNIMPNPNQLIMSNAAGKQPDVALGINMDTPVDYAMRGAVADLSQFPDFAEVLQQFHPGLMRTLQYRGGTYALPETQYYQLLFYRTDIFEDLGLEPPDTWEDVYQILRTLQENGMNFYYPKDFYPFLFQHGGEAYANDGMRTLLGNETSTEAFEQYTDLFQKYNLPWEIPSFFNHFREGDIPIGVADINTYILLTNAAPEIAGRWAIAPMPGTVQADGTVARWGQQASFTGVIMEKSKKKDQAWQFLKWYLSTDVQTRYGLNLESYFGPDHRWNTANLQAAAAMPWSEQELQVIEEQNKWVRDLPVVPGYYYLSREMDFAWNRVILSGVPAKESLEKSALSLQREMDRKQEDLGLPGDTDLHIPAIRHPYDWRNPQE